ncbi:MAG: hypothetical protein NTV01_07330, partial [Bacteroidia bacterium]|nr:hypothetical protein [Bacteroidia bacterium]
MYNTEKLLFSSNREGNYQIYEVGITLDDNNGGYKIDQSSLKPLSYNAINTNAVPPARIIINDNNNQQYPFLYFNAVNQTTPRAIFWSSDAPDGFGSFDLYGCAVPFEVKVHVILADRFDKRFSEPIGNSILKVDGFLQETRNEQSTTFSLYSHLQYTIWGGSTAQTYNCNLDPSYIHIGYSEIVDQKPFVKEIHQTLMTGPAAKSQLTQRFGHLPLDKVFRDTSLVDTVYITRAWKKKEPCPGKLNIEVKNRSVAYFQTGYWEVNTTENLKRDLKALHEGFQVDDDNDYMDPTE